MGILVLHGHNPEDIKTWDELVSRAPTPDVYYRPAYVRAYGLTGHGRPLALVASSGGTEALFPLLIRQLTVNGKTIRDAITPYGYGGVLHLAGLDPANSVTARELLPQVRDWARASGLAACTIRLHPLLNQESLWGDAETTGKWIRAFPRGQTTAIDLENWSEVGQWVPGISKGRRYDLKRARSCLQLRVSQGVNAAGDLKIFESLYAESMDRVHASEFFLFRDAYYEYLAAELGERFVHFLAFKDDLPVAAAIFLADRDFAHYHLAGSNDAGRRSGASTLLVVAAADWARQRGCSVLHLGGGLKNDDSLWAFKHSFGGRSFFYSYMTLVANDEQYEDLTGHAGAPWPYVDVPQPVDGPKTDELLSVVPHRRVTVHTDRTKVVGIGAGGHAKVIIDILSHSPRFQVVGLVELATRLFGETIEGSLILGDDGILPELLLEGVGCAFIGIGGVGNNTPRARAFERVQSLGFDIINAVHPLAVVARSAELGRGVCIMAGAVVNPSAVIGNNVILNTHCTVEHDCVIGDHVHIAPGATLSGAVRIGRLSHIGTGASVRQGVRIGERAVVGVGSVVVSDVPDDVVVVGSPARSLRVVSRE